MSRLQDGPFQDKTVNELKLCFVKTWWVHWPSFISLPPINSLCRTSWVKYRAACKRQSFTQTQISSEFSWLARQNHHNHTGTTHTHWYTHTLSPSQFTQYYLTLSTSTHLICCFHTCSNELPQSESHHYPSCTFCTSHSFTELNSCVNVPRQECTAGGWLSIRVSAGLFWGISPAHLFDPKHTALSPPEQCSCALGRNQDVISNWLEGKVCLNPSFLFFFIILSLTLSHLMLLHFHQGPFDPCHVTARCPSADSHIENVFWTKTKPNSALWWSQKKQWALLWFDIYDEIGKKYAETHND